MTLTVAPLATDDVPTSTRIRDAALVCIGRFGLAKTTVDDIAREAGCSRATLYRYYDGKPAIVKAAIVSELDRVSSALVDAGRAEPTFADAVVAVVVLGARELRAHDALQFLLAHERDAVLGHLAFASGDRVLVAVGDAIAPAFDRWLSVDRCTRVGEWLARVVRSYVLMARPPIDFTDPDAARGFLQRLVVPGLVPPGLAEHREPS
jgi:AcrR family transcriptional regulator